MADCRELASQALECETAGAVRALLAKWLPQARVLP
jgi:phosphoenolpyruvate-protein kinase (PTS system EI component)